MYLDTLQISALLVGEVWGRHAPIYTEGVGLCPEKREFRR